MTRKFFKDNAVLIAGIALPLLLAAAFALARLAPEKAVVDPQYKAVYMIDTYGRISYSISDTNKLEVTYNVPEANPDQQCPTCRIYIFDGATGQTEEIAFTIPPVRKEKTAQLKIKIPRLSEVAISGGSTAPDGYSFRQGGYSSSGLITELFTYGRRNYPNAIVKDGRVIPFKQDLPYYSVQFIGWTKSTIPAQAK